MSEEFEGLHVVVTGGAGGLGTAVVALLVERGASVHVPCVTERERDRFTLRAHPRVRVEIGVDLGDQAATDAFYDSTPALYASIHLAGGFSMASLDETPMSELRRLLDLNAVTCFGSCRAAVRRIRAGGRGGRLVNVAAKPAVVPTAGMAAYAASKAAVVSITQSLSEELARDGIWVNAVVPSIMDTPANRASMPDAPFDAWPKPSEVAETVVFLASPRNVVTRGALVPVYGKS